MLFYTVNDRTLLDGITRFFFLTEYYIWYVWKIDNDRTHQHNANTVQLGQNGRQQISNAYFKILESDCLYSELHEFVISKPVIRMMSSFANIFYFIRCCRYVFFFSSGGVRCLQPPLLFGLIGYFEFVFVLYSGMPLGENVIRYTVYHIRGASIKRDIHFIFPAIESVFSLSPTKDEDVFTKIASIFLISLGLWLYKSIHRKSNLSM